MPYDINGKPIEDDDDAPIMKAVVAVIVTILTIAIICSFIQQESVENETLPVMSHTIVLDYNNAALMHAYGMPTAEDVMYYHLHGQWGYMQDGEQVTFDRLPGRADRWDVLYGIAENPKFDK